MKFGLLRKLGSACRLHRLHRCWWPPKRVSVTVHCPVAMRSAVPCRSVHCRRRCLAARADRYRVSDADRRHLRPQHCWDDVQIRRCQIFCFWGGHWHHELWLWHFWDLATSVALDGRKASLWILWIVSTSLRAGREMILDRPGKAPTPTSHLSEKAAACKANATQQEMVFKK